MNKILSFPPENKHATLKYKNYNKLLVFIKMQLIQVSNLALKNISMVLQSQEIRLIIFRAFQESLILF